MEILINILIYAGIVQGFHMAFLLNHNKRQNSANKYLATLLSVMSVSIAHSVIVIPEIHTLQDDPFRIKEPFLMLVIPLIWFYVKKLEQPTFHFSLKMSGHFLPFLVFMSINIPALIHEKNAFTTRFLATHSALINGTIWLVLLVQYSFYLHQIIRITRKVRLNAQQELSNIEHVDLSWLKTFLYAFIVVFIVLGIVFAGAIHHFGTAWMNPMISLVFALSIFILGYKGLFQQSIFSNAEAIAITEPEPDSNESKKTKTSDSNLSNTVLHYMKTQQPHRDAALTLTSLAKQVNMSRNQLSEVINTSIGSNFYDFVNSYRVEDVKQLLVHPTYQHYTLLAIAFEAGFPSKSTFNTVFKKHTGLTPSEYKKTLL